MAYSRNHASTLKKLVIKLHSHLKFRKFDFKQHFEEGLQPLKILSEESLNAFCNSAVYFGMTYDDM